jgi:hypothetical protein
MTAENGNMPPDARMSLPPLPNLTPAIVYQPWEVNALVRSYGEACHRAGMEQAAVICDKRAKLWGEDDDTPAGCESAYFQREDEAEFCAAGIRAAAKQGGQG